jgi:hypothetical protein
MAFLGRGERELRRTVGAVLFSEQLSAPTAVHTARAQYVATHPEQPLLALVMTECNQAPQNVTQVTPRRPLCEIDDRSKPR